MSDSEPTLPDFPTEVEPIYSAVVEVYDLGCEMLGFLWTFCDGVTKYQIVPVTEVLSVLQREAQ